MKKDYDGGLACWNCGDSLNNSEILKQESETRAHGLDPKKESEYYICDCCSSRRDEVQDDYRWMECCGI